MSEGCNNPNSATPRPWMLASNDPTIIVSERLDKSGDCFVIADVLNGMRHSTKEDEANAALIVHAVNNIDRITAERDRLKNALEATVSELTDVMRMPMMSGYECDALVMGKAALAALTPSFPDRTIDNTPSCGMENDFRRATSADTDAEKKGGGT